MDWYSRTFGGLFLKLKQCEYGEFWFTHGWGADSVARWWNKRFLIIQSFLNMGLSRPLFRSFSSFSHSNFHDNFYNINWKNIDGVLGFSSWLDEGYLLNQCFILSEVVWVPEEFHSYLNGMFINLSAYLCRWHIYQEYILESHRYRNL